MAKLHVRKSILLLFLINVLIAMSTGCAYQRQLEKKAIGLPEEILIKKPVQNHYHPKIVVCDFQSPRYVGGIGKRASKMLFLELLKKNINADLLPANVPMPDTTEQIFELMTEKSYDMLVAGEVTYFLDGMISADSRVESEMVVYSISNESLCTVGYAKAIESASPLPTTFFFSIRSWGRPAPSAESLLKRNSSKFALMIEEILARK
ncbi:hypothetical protein [Desulfosarcina ovata]|uniref:hypothetical protein n=1 Tax=Desulfosarcina ovata TaxID=83564 RepID=UPI0012D355F6|nr:hypothetical protein [Desulfosarcina ovata]